MGFYKEPGSPTLTYQTYLWPYAQDPSAAGCSSSEGPKLEEVFRKEPVLNPLRQGSRLARLPNLGVTNRDRTIVRSIGEKTVGLNKSVQIKGQSDAGIALTL